MGYFLTQALDVLYIISHILIGGGGEGAKSFLMLYPHNFHPYIKCVCGGGGGGNSLGFGVFLTQVLNFYRTYIISHILMGGGGRKKLSYFVTKLSYCVCWIYDMRIIVMILMVPLIFFVSGV